MKTSDAPIPQIYAKQIVKLIPFIPRALDRGYIAITAIANERTHVKIAAADLLKTISMSSIKSSAAVRLVLRRTGCIR